MPDHSTLSRRAETLQVPRPRAGKEPVHLLVDSTGLRFNAVEADGQDQLWEDRVVLDPDFYDALRRHPIPSARRRSASCATAP